MGLVADIRKAEAAARPRTADGGQCRRVGCGYSQTAFWQGMEFRQIPGASQGTLYVNGHPLQERIFNREAFQREVAGYLFDSASSSA